MEKVVNIDKEYPHWNNQNDNDIYDSINDWDRHKYVCIMKDGEVCKWYGFRDENYYGEITEFLVPENDEQYGVDDIEYWTKLI